MGKKIDVCDNFDGINSVNKIFFNGLVPEGKKDLLLSRQLQEIIELKEGKSEERKILLVQIMIENSTRENKSFYDKLNLFSLDDDLKRLFLASLDLYISDKNYKVLRYIFTHENGDGNFSLNIPTGLIADLSSKISSFDLFGDLENFIFNGIEYKKNGNDFFSLKGEKLDIFSTFGNKIETKKDIDLSEYLTQTEIYDYCRYFNIDTETCKKDMASALELLEGMPENIKQFVGSNNILLLSIFREVQRVGLNYVNFKQIIAMAIIESEFGESSNDGSYKGPIQIGEIALKAVKKTDTEIVEEVARFLGKSPTKLSIHDCSKVKVGLTLGTLYLRNAEVEISDKKLPKTPNIPEKYLREVNARLAAKGIKIDDTTFKSVVFDIQNYEQSKIAFYSLQRYNGSKSKVSYALAIMCVAKKLEI